MINEHKQGSMALYWSWTFHLAKICRHFNAALTIATISSVNTFFLYNFARDISNEWRSTMTLSYCSTNNTSTTTLNWLIHKDKYSVFDIPLSLQFTNIQEKNIFCDYIFTITSLALYSCRRFFFTRKTDLYKRIMLIH